MTPVADPPNRGGFTSLITEYGIMAAPDAIPNRIPTSGPRKTAGSPNRIQVITTEHHGRPCEDDRFATTDAIGEKTQQRAAHHPSQGNGSGQHDGGLVLPPASFLQIPHAPRHAKDGCRNEEQPEINPHRMD
jgi:hypothetical protein